MYFQNQISSRVKMVAVIGKGSSYRIFSSIHLFLWHLKYLSINWSWYVGQNGVSVSMRWHETKYWYYTDSHFIDVIIMASCTLVSIKSCALCWSPFENDKLVLKQDEFGHLQIHAKTLQRPNCRASVTLQLMLGEETSLTNQRPGMRLLTNQRPLSRCRQ